MSIVGVVVLVVVVVVALLLLVLLLLGVQGAAVEITFVRSGGAPLEK